MTNIQAIDLLKDLEQSLDDYCELNDEGKTAFRMAITALKLFGISEQLPSAQPEITPDGTLNVSIDADIANVGRILLSQAGTQRGGLYYKDEQPEIIRCRECKFLEYDSIFDGHFCQNRRVKLDHFCGYAERRTDG